MDHYLVIFCRQPSFVACRDRIPKPGKVIFDDRVLSPIGLRGCSVPLSSVACNDSSERKAFPMRKVKHVVSIDRFPIDFNVVFFLFAQLVFPFLRSILADEKSLGVTHTG